MKKIFLILTPLSMLAVSACDQAETSATREGSTADTVASAAQMEMPPSITATGIYRCADNTILYIDFLGKNEAADIRIGDKVATAIRVTAPVVTPAADPVSAGSMKSADGENSLSGEGKQIDVKLAGKAAQTCKSG
jgi:hypothetical protein